jgi:GntR family transcriptional regulator
MPFRIRVQPGSSTPIYRQIVDQVRTGASLGVLSPGDALPSVRALSEELLVNPNTVAKAYAELARDGTVEAHAGRGVFIAERRQVLSGAERRLRLEAAVDELLREAVFLQCSKEQIHRTIDDRLALLRTRTEKGDGK